MDSKKIQEAHNWPRPISTKEIWSFFGLAGYYRQWSDECEESFQKLKTALTTSPALVLPTDLRSYAVYCDASRIGLGALLMQNGKANVVADALSMKAESMSSLAFISAVERPLAMDVQDMANRFVMLDILELPRILACIVAQSSLLEHIKACQFDDPHLLVLKDMIWRSGAKKVVIEYDGVMRLQGQICVPNVDGLRELILQEAYSSRWAVRADHSDFGGYVKVMHY
ncbi:uncharacterized protein [Nicotiana tomentosiformis]|uniref:uncharacterized protein n=1 Tax=Nicotiana tomentosiformis TaxID=4098 RepID=UPI00388C79FD